MVNILKEGKRTLEFIWEMNKIKQLKECREKEAAGKLPVGSYDNMVEAIRLMESGAMEKDKLIQAAHDNWRRMTRKEQQEKKKEYREYMENELKKQKGDIDENTIDKA